MITGYNTDVRHADVVIHVQTEDKGANNPFIESLVYVGGRVLAAKRASYASLLAEGKGPEAVSEMMDLQHRAVIAAIRQGKFDDKLHALTGARPAVPPAAAAVAAAVDALSEPTDMLTATKITEAERTLDQVILEYLSMEADQEQLRLAVDGDAELTLGRPSVLQLAASSSRSGKPVAGARVEVKLISTVAEARTLAAGDTDHQGGIQLAFQIPDLKGGAAALIITANSHIGSAELKHLL